MDGITAFEAGLLAARGADADHVLAAHDGDRVAVLVTVHVDHDRWPPSRTEPPDGLVGHDDPGVVARRRHGRIELHPCWHPYSPRSHTTGVRPAGSPSRPA